MNQKEIPKVRKVLKIKVNYIPSYHVSNKIKYRNNKYYNSEDRILILFDLYIEIKKPPKL